MAARTTPTSRPSRFGSRHQVDMFGEGRVCTDTTCDTRLSQYNAEALCGVHGVRTTRP